ncbi:anthranilate phosphoribosyltransferase [Neisseria elongata subsp. glycolytica ATCC 29315]|uniref:Anthranilate phosphoribosyltransferase n=1 Tax=Neisseria elongata subsp. glycolytica ATCC 29315 TaxID=546263 RepID=D4DST4_NEIEG|nr:anthranilate phosphoribosyltransferase [Neisseria elongata]AJE18986.1 anthranilate phosphoribosyltransferase [Neisseria elongata subsp. glycolytica ATCC 29315]EFE49118.1 anthranilate phosphoribosyltransferase [Neisseria elongata subsp. glycolytica ATCC 29315]SQH50885.1 anthranilate phosphoribosyltransferase [Neisseria elongata subsp. glycolytica]
MITPQQAIERLISNNELFYDEMTDLMRQIMSGQVPPEQIAAILTGLRIKVETVSEITAAAAVMREFATPVPVVDKNGLVDIVGTGGDGAKTFNISTTAMFVAAAAGAKVAKHGGRSVSSSSGAADVVEQMGAKTDLSPEQVARTIEETGIGFMFAPNHHSAMRYVAPVRRSLGFRSIFNILGPLTNPAGAPNQLLGVFHKDLCGILSRVLQQLGSQHVLVVCGSDGLDEITLTGETYVAELKDGTIREYTISPEQFGLPLRRNLDEIKVADSRESLSMMNAVLAGEAGAARDIVLLNAAAALYAGNVVSSLTEGMAAAREAIDSGRAKVKQEEFIAATLKG